MFMMVVCIMHGVLFNEILIGAAFLLENEKTIGHSKVRTYHVGISTVGKSLGLLK